MNQDTTKLSEALREVARRYYEGGLIGAALTPQPAGAEVYPGELCGLCFQASHASRAAGGSGHYVTMSGVMDELGYLGGHFEDTDPWAVALDCADLRYPDWEPRAYMALLLAEYLEETGR